MRSPSAIGTMSASSPTEARSILSTVNSHAVDLTESRELALEAAHAAVDKKATNIRILELAALLRVTDYFVLASAANERQLGTVAEEVERRLKAGTGRSPERREGTQDAGWVLLDYGEIVVHGFTEAQRAFYDLERLWSDAPTVELDEGSAG